IKQLLDEGHSVFCFDKNDNIGGIWYRNADSGVDANEMKVFDSLILTISMKLMAYSDFLIGDRVFYTHKQYYKYLEAYADKYGLQHCIKLRSVVNEVRKNEDGSWTVIETMGMRSEAHQFDAVAVCCGPFQMPNLESVIDIDKFSGEVVHSFTYRNNAKF